jgi:D-mannonate dehydratase
VQIIAFKKMIEYIELECTKLEHATKSMKELECAIKRTKELERVAKKMRVLTRKGIIIQCYMGVQYK